ncbi:restriction endonuclease subunit S, partial [Mesorhizobium sp. M6A.T.Ca.TU.002.02.2.1]
LLQGMAGGTTIPNVAMGELKQMPVPIPDVAAQKEILKKFHEYFDLLRNIDELREVMTRTEEAIFSLTLSGKREGSSGVQLSAERKGTNQA